MGVKKLDNENFSKFLENLESYLIESCNYLLDKLPENPNNHEVKSVLGGLVSRQVTLSIQMVNSPNMLNGHAAPLFLRAMTDLQISLAWILIDLEDRVKKYVIYGLGEEKLILEHYKKELEDNTLDLNYKDEVQKIIQFKEEWIRAQKPEYLVEVNLGNWAQLDYRRMAQEAGKESLYKFPYKIFSQNAHNMWNFISLYNCTSCENPLHRYHLVPSLKEAQIDIDFLYRAFKYTDQVYELIIQSFNIYSPYNNPLNFFEQKILEN